MPWETYRWDISKGYNNPKVWINRVRAKGHFQWARQTRKRRYSNRHLVFTGNTATLYDLCKIEAKAFGIIMNSFNQDWPRLFIWIVNIVLKKYPSVPQKLRFCFRVRSMEMDSERNALYLSCWTWTFLSWATGFSWKKLRVPKALKLCCEMSPILGINPVEILVLSLGQETFTTVHIRNDVYLNK